MSSTNHFDVDSHLVHDIHTVFKGKHNTFLSRTGDMGRMMNIEIQAKDGTIHLLISNIRSAPFPNGRIDNPSEPIGTLAARSFSWS